VRLSRFRISKRCSRCRDVCTCRRQPGGERTHEQSDRKHHQQGNDVLQVLTGERVVRGHEEEVEREHRCHGRNDARHSPRPQGAPMMAGMKTMALLASESRPCGVRRPPTRPGRRGLSWPGREPAPRGTSCRGRRLSTFSHPLDDVDVDVAALAQQAVDHIRGQERPPSGLAGLPDDDPGDVLRMREADDLVAVSSPMRVTVSAPSCSARCMFCMRVVRCDSLRLRVGWSRRWRRSSAR